MEIVSDPYNRGDLLIGDVYFGYLVPTVICGRSTCFRRDIVSFVTHWCDTIFGGNLRETLLEYPDLGLDQLGLEFRDRLFSKILVISPKEDLTDVWQVLWGVWADVFLRETEKNKKEYTVLFRSNCIFLMFYLYFCQTESHNLPIPLSLGTFEKCLEVAEVALKEFKVTSVLNVLKYMVTQKCFSFSSYDGVQYLHQNKFGNPLKVTK